LEFPERLKSLRKDKGMTQEELGLKINVTKVSISGYENGNRTPDMDTLQKIADVLETTIDYLLGRQDQNNYIPEWATSKDKRDFKKMLEDDGEIMFDGVPMSERDRERVMDVLSGLFWEAKEMNKKTYGKKNNKKNSLNENNKE